MLTIDCAEKMVSCHSFTENEHNSVNRNRKVQDTKRKLRSGKYNLEKKLSIAMDRLLEEILEDKPENQTYSVVSEKI